MQREKSFCEMLCRARIEEYVLKEKYCSCAEDVLYETRKLIEQHQGIKKTFLKMIYSKKFARLAETAAEEADNLAEIECRNLLQYAEQLECPSGMFPCVDCPFGNGEGGCTIPGYCDSSFFEVQCQKQMEERRVEAKKIRNCFLGVFE